MDDLAAGRAAVGARRSRLDGARGLALGALQERKQVRARADGADQLAAKAIDIDHTVATLDQPARRQLLHETEEEAGRAGATDVIANGGAAESLEDAESGSAISHEEPGHRTG